MDDCIEAYHECPHRGVSIQVDSTDIVIAEAAKHNQIIYAKCVCADAWSGNDCTMPPLPPPTIEPWPDPYADYDAAMQADQATSPAPLSARRADAGRAAALAVAVAMAAGGLARRGGARAG